MKCELEKVGNSSRITKLDLALAAVARWKAAGGFL